VPDPAIGVDRIDSRLLSRDGAVRGHDLVVINRNPELKILLEKVFFADGLNRKYLETGEMLSDYLDDFLPGLILVAVESHERVEVVRTLSRYVPPSLPLVAVAIDPDRELVLNTMAAGAADFIFAEEAREEISRKLENHLQRAGQKTSEAPASSNGAGSAGRKESVRMVCGSPQMRKVVSLAEKVAPADATVLIQGESGTGKEVLARHIHQYSSRSGRNFVAINCGALPESLLESELFGHERGAFTGALDRRQGLFEMAEGGTVFLDEVGEMTPAMQVKVLRVLQSGEFRRLGGSRLLKADVRLLAASNRDLQTEVREGRFRLDLYYRLNVVALELPPLRQRTSDIPALIDHFSARLEGRRGLGECEFSPQALELLAGLQWEGNVRELENLVERLLLLSDSSLIGPAEIREHLQQGLCEPVLEELDSSASLEDVKRAHIAKALAKNRGNKTKTARQLGINVKTLYNLVRKLGIEA
jgi:DNA-binding NtrC family response regulator